MFMINAHQHMNYMANLSFKSCIVWAEFSLYNWAEFSLYNNEIDLLPIWVFSHLGTDFLIVVDNIFPSRIKSQTRYDMRHMK